MSRLQNANVKDNSKYLVLENDVYLKQLEMPVVYKTGNDSLYEVDQKTIDFLQKCDGRLRLSEIDAPTDFLDYVLDEDIAFIADDPRVKEHHIGINLDPSFRYLLIEITDRCNLSCKHCYQGESKTNDLELSKFDRVVNEFEEMGGLRLIVSGGEPLLHPQFGEINQLMRERAFRSILLTNGILIDEDFASNNNFNEVQVSLDGTEEGHDYLRGRGSFVKTTEALKLLQEKDIPISIASMVHAKNLDEFANLAKLVSDLDAVSWSIDVPSSSGRLIENSKLVPSLDRIKPIMELQFGAEIHDSRSNLVCGAHLACVKSSGALTKCGLYTDWSGGNIDEGLRKCWLNLPRMSFTELNCDCKFIEECRGGCRYRAECYNGKKSADPIKCLLYGVG